jgi:hypothetical protein
VSESERVSKGEDVCGRLSVCSTVPPVVSERIQRAGEQVSERCMWLAVIPYTMSCVTVQGCTVGADIMGSVPAIVRLAADHIWECRDVVGLAQLS